MTVGSFFQWWVPISLLPAAYYLFLETWSDNIVSCWSKAISRAWRPHQPADKVPVLVFTQAEGHPLLQANVLWVWDRAAASHQVFGCRFKVRTQSLHGALPVFLATRRWLLAIDKPNNPWEWYWVPLMEKNFDILLLTLVFLHREETCSYNFLSHVLVVVYYSSILKCPPQAHVHRWCWFRRFWILWGKRHGWQRWVTGE